MYYLVYYGGTDDDGPPGGKMFWILAVTIFGGRVLVLYWGERVFLTIFGGRVLTVGVWLW